MKSHVCLRFFIRGHYIIGFRNSKILSYIHLCCKERNVKLCSTLFPSQLFVYKMCMVNPKLVRGTKNMYAIILLPIVVLRVRTPADFWLYVFVIV